MEAWSPFHTWGRTSDFRLTPSRHGLYYILNLNIFRLLTVSSCGKPPTPMQVSWPLRNSQIVLPCPASPHIFLSLLNAGPTLFSSRYFSFFIIIIFPSLFPSTSFTSESVNQRNPVGPPRCDGNVIAHRIFHDNFFISKFNYFKIKLCNRCKFVHWTDPSTHRNFYIFKLSTHGNFYIFNCTVTSATW